MTNAINAIQLNYFAYANESIKKEDIKEQVLATNVVSSTQKDAPSKEGYSVSESFVQQTGSVFDMFRSSFFTQRGIKINKPSSISAIQNISSASTKEQLAKIGSEMVNLQQELTILVEGASKLADVDSSDENVKQYQTKYIELYNKLAEKKAEYDNFVSANNIDSEEAKTICKDAYDKYTNYDKEFINKYNEIVEKRNELANQTKTLADIDFDDDTMTQLNALDQVYELKQTSLEQQYAITGIDLFSTDTKLDKISTDSANLLIKFQNISEQRQLNAYQLAAAANGDMNDSSMQQLQKQDLELAMQQKELAEKLKIQNNNYDYSAYNLLLAPQKLSLSLQAVDLEDKAITVNNKIKTNAFKIEELKTSGKDADALKSLQAINQVYELELSNINTQLASVLNSFSTQTNIDNISKITEQNIQKDYELLKIKNQREVIAYQLAVLEDNKTNAAEIAKLKKSDAELEKQQKQLEAQSSKEKTGEDISSVKLDASLMRKLLMPQKQNLESQVNDLTSKIDMLENKLKDIENQLKTTKKTEDKEQLEAIKQVYELEVINLKEQLKLIEADYQYVK